MELQWLPVVLAVGEALCDAALAPAKSDANVDIRTHADASRAQTENKNNQSLWRSYSYNQTRDTVDI